MDDGKHFNLQEHCGLDYEKNFTRHSRKNHTLHEVKNLREKKKRTHVCENRVSSHEKFNHFMTYFYEIMSTEIFHCHWYNVSFKLFSTRTNNRLTV